jgi:hypothetical protein
VSDFGKTLLAEIEGLAADIADNPDPRYAKLEKLYEAAALYGLSVGIRAIRETAENVRAAQRVISRQRSSSASRQAILDRAKEIIGEADTPVATATLFEIISEEMEIPGTNPKNNLSAMLSNSDEFVSHGRAGWTLAETTEASDDLLNRQTSEAPNSSAALPTAESQVRPVDPWSGGGT